MIRTLSPLLLLAVGCSPDTDEDGLSNREERKLGSDPELVDSDGDGLADGDEVEIGANPILADTDEDTYLDGDEVAEGTDPTNADSRIYTGYWPYNPDKDSVAAGSFDGMPKEVGSIFPRHQARDQYRERVDLYDFASQGKLTVIDASATWCVPCQNVASWIAGFNDPNNYESDFAPVRRKLNRGEFQWVTVMTDGDGADGPTIAEVEEWDAAFPNDNVMVQIDKNEDVLRAINFDGVSGLAWPSYVVVDENMEVVFVGGSAATLAFVRDNI